VRAGFAGPPTRSGSVRLVPRLDLFAVPPEKVLAELVALVGAEMADRAEQRAAFLEAFGGGDDGRAAVVHGDGERVPQGVREVERDALVLGLVGHV